MHASMMVAVPVWGFNVTCVSPAILVCWVEQRRFHHPHGCHPQHFPLAHRLMCFQLWMWIRVDMNLQHNHLGLEVENHLMYHCVCKQLARFLNCWKNLSIYKNSYGPKISRAEVKCHFSSRHSEVLILCKWEITDNNINTLYLVQCNSDHWT